MDRVIPVACQAAEASAVPWNSILTAVLTALLAAFGTFVVQRYVALRNQKATVIAANRVKWIEKFREDTAAFCELAHHVAYHRVKMKAAKAKADEKDDASLREQEDEHRKEVNEKSLELNKTYYHLILRLNTTVRRSCLWQTQYDEQERRFEAKKKLKAKFKEVESYFNSLGDYNDTIYDDVMKKNDELIEMVRDFLAREWLKVERLE